MVLPAPAFLPHIPAAGAAANLGRHPNPLEAAAVTVPGAEDRL